MVIPSCLVVGFAGDNSTDVSKQNSTTVQIIIVGKKETTLKSPRRKESERRRRDTAGRNYEEKSRNQLQLKESEEKA